MSCVKGKEKQAASELVDALESDRLQERRVRRGDEEQRRQHVVPLEPRRAKHRRCQDGDQGRREGQQPVERHDPQESFRHEV